MVGGGQHAPFGTLTMTQGSALVLGALVLCSGGVLHCPHEEQRYEPGNGMVLAIENHSFGHIDVDTLDGVPKALPLLQTLILRNTSIKMIAPDSFAQLSTLNCLDLTDNEIGYLRDHGDMLRGVANLTTFILARNHLRAVTDSAFIYARHLLRLDLSENELDVLSLSNAAFRGLVVLEELYLDNNDLTHLSPLLLSHTPSLLKLSVSNNPLVKIGVYSLPQLQVFIAYNNLLSEFPRFPQSTRMVDLRDGHISQIESTRSTDLGRFAALLLSGNEWTCSCDTVWFLQWSTFSQNIVADYSNMTCSEPKTYRGVAFAIALNALTCSKNEENESVAFNTQIHSLRRPLFRVEVGQRLQTTDGTLRNTATTHTALPLSPSSVSLPPLPKSPVVDGSKTLSNRAAIEKYLNAKKGISPLPNVTSDAFEDELISFNADIDGTPYSPHSPSNTSSTILFSSLIGALSWPTLTLSLIFGILFAAFFVIAALIVRTGVHSFRHRRLLGRYTRQSPTTSNNQPSLTVSPARSDIILSGSTLDEPRRYNALDQYVPRMSLPDSDQLTASKARGQPLPATSANDVHSEGSNACLVLPFYDQEELNDDQWTISPVDAVTIANRAPIPPKLTVESIHS